MKNRIAVLQPSYIPWLGVFDQINKVDTFIFYDDVLYTKNDWRNRNRIKTPRGTTWLTIPVEIKGRLEDYLLIKNVKIINQEVLKKHLKTIELNYKKSQFFEEFYPLTAALFEINHHLLADLNIEITKKICTILGIKNVEFLRSSELDVINENPTGRLIDICKKLKATHYLTGNNSKNYLEEEKFIQNDIVLEYQNYKHPVYKQLWGDFVPYLSIVDLILNEGRNSLKILSNS